MKLSNYEIKLSHILIFTFSLVHCLENTSVHDGEVLQLQPKELGRIEIHPQLLKHNPNGRYSHPTQ
jgi:hypothetical protein